MTPVSPVLPSAKNEVPETIYAKDQPEYIPLPTVVQQGGYGTVTSRWRLTWRERFAVLFSGNLWIQQLAFGERLQPIMPRTDEPGMGQCL